MATQERKYPHITVTQGMSGWFAVMMWWNNEEPDIGGFAEPYTTGMGRWSLQAEAIAEAKTWAEREGLPFYEPAVLDNRPARQDVEQQIREIIPGIIVKHL